MIFGQLLIDIVLHFTQTSCQQQINKPFLSMAIARITKNLMYIGVDAIKKFQSRLTALLKNKTL